LNIISIVGARPQFIKAAAIARATTAFPQMRHTVLHTGQHYDQNMSEIFFSELEIPQPAHNIGVGSAPHGAQTGRMLEAIEQVLLQAIPDWVLVYGDTNSTLAGALAAVKLHIATAHIEAGLRSYNRRMPEEINRILTDHASDLLFAPTAKSVANLRSEGFPKNRIVLVGDVMYDAALFYSAKAEQQSRVLEDLHLQPKQYILATIHRAENTDDVHRLRAIFEALSLTAERIPVVIPLHPRTYDVLGRERILSQKSALKDLLIIKPLGYLDMVMLEKHARLIATDSGGVQKEAFFHKVPCVTLRTETEWVELVELNWNLLVDPICAGKISEALLNMLNHCGAEGDPYGGGAAAHQILRVLNAYS